MKITKFGHCCLLIEEQGLRILTDPGFFTVDVHQKIENLDIILITHEHGDHFHIDSLKIILKNNLKAKVVTNKAVGKLLDAEKISYELVGNNQIITIGEVLIEGFGEKHADIYKTIPAVENTGYLIAGKFFYPGDAFTNPGREIEILALPVAGPWMKISEAIDFAKEVKPKICFPVHDGFLSFTGPFYSLPQNVLKQMDIEFRIPTEKEAMQF